MSREVTGLQQKGPERRLRLWVMFDRDADGADARRPSRNVARAEAACRHFDSDPNPLRWHRLHRRSIESYLPASALREASTGATWDRAVAALEALRADDREVADSVDMKTGLQKDLPSPVKNRIKVQPNDPEATRQATEASIGGGDWRPPFDRVDAAHRAGLLGGFGKDVSGLFSSDSPHLEPDFSTEFDETATAEGKTAEALIESILEYL